MSGEDDTFEIDIYGDDGTQEELEVDGTGQENDTQPIVNVDSQPSFSNQETQIDAEKDQKATPSTMSMSSQQGAKRKHDESDQNADSYDQGYLDQGNQSFDPNATTALKLTDLHWWTTEEDLRAFCAQADVEEELQDLAFGEHKINGKSKGEAYLEFRSVQAATATKRVIEHASQIKEESGLRKSPFIVAFTSGGNPHRLSSTNGVKKEYPQNSGRGGSYNNYNNNRGGYVGRGNYNNRGGYNNNNNHHNNNHNMQSRQNGQAGSWGMNGMNGGNFGGAGFGVNPMMAGGFNNMNMGNFGNMGRGCMMNNMGMMGRGGFGGMGNMGMGMGNMNMNGMMGGGRGGGMMGGGGAGWNGGYQQQAGGFNAGGQQGNKRAKME